VHFSKLELAALTLAGSALPFGAMAADNEAIFPQRPVTLVIGFTPGGGADPLARLLAKHMSEELGQKVTVDNRPGAGSNIAAEAVARAVPDGYTLYFSSRPNTVHKTMYSDLKYDFNRDLVPVGLVATMPMVVVAGKHAPIHTIQELITLAKAYPGGLTCASAGVGTSGHLLCELFQQEAGIDMLHVPYRGGAPALADVVGGRVDVQFVSLPAALPQIQSGHLRALAVMSRQRVPAARHIATIAESGLANLNLESWYGVMVPAGTPDHAVARLNQSINTVMTRQDVQETLMELAYAAPQQPNTQQTFGDLIAEETQRWTGILRDRNINPLH
jgi:tripartite-type tricarboxylate transporter receptor subunit TctC